MYAPANCFESRWRRVRSPESRSSSNCGRCVNASSRTRSSKTSPTHSMSRLIILGLLTISALVLVAERPELLAPAAGDDTRVVHRWSLPGDPHGLALGSDGTMYVGLAQPPSVLAINPRSGALRPRVVLASAQTAPLQYPPPPPTNL